MYEHLIKLSFVNRYYVWIPRFNRKKFNGSLLSLFAIFAV